MFCYRAKNRFFFFLNLSIRHFSFRIPNTIYTVRRNFMDKRGLRGTKIILFNRLTSVSFFAANTTFPRRIRLFPGVRPEIVWPHILLALHVSSHGFSPIVLQTGTQADTFVRWMIIRTIKRGSVNVRLKVIVFFLLLFYRFFAKVRNEIDFI